jgi:hypothetical protein
MAKEIKTEITIHASPDKVWKLLTEFDNYSIWNPFIKSINGDVKVGSKITVRIEPPGASGMTFKPIVMTYEPDNEFSWLGKLLFKGLFDGAHKFEIVDNKNGTTTFIQSETFTGILVPIFAKQLDNNTRKGFEEMNKKLKEMAEL